jgi:transcription termination/antitermination protein NusA
MSISANRLEILQIADAVAREKGIDKEIVLKSIENAFAKAARARYGNEHDIHAIMDPRSGEMRIERHLTVVEEIENPMAHLTLAEGKKRDPNAEIGTVFIEQLPPVDPGRMAAQMGKQVIMHDVREAERKRQYEEYKDRAGEILNGIVKRIEFNNVIVDLGRAEGVMRRNDQIPRENLRVGDRVRAYLYEVKEEAKGPMIFLSRSHEQFMIKLFAQEVPEVYDGVIEIRACARDPGSRAKIAVLSHDSSIDPVGACVGMRGARVQAVVGELAGEKIDIIPWSQDVATFIVNALQPAEVSKVVMEPEVNRVDVVVPQEQLSLAIGRRGQNVRLASKLTGWSLDIMTEEEDSDRRQKEFVERTNLFMMALGADETLGQLLASEGFETVEDVAYIDPQQLADIDGVNEEIAAGLQSNAMEYLAEVAAELDAKRVALGVDDDIKAVASLTPQMLIALGEGGVKSLEDFAGLVSDDLRGWTDIKNGEKIRQSGVLDTFNLSVEAAEAMILEARIAAGWIEAPPEPEHVEEEDAEYEGEELVADAAEFDDVEETRT